MSELTPAPEGTGTDTGISVVDLATFLIDDRLSDVRKQFFENYHYKDGDEEGPIFIAALFRIAYAQGLCDAYLPQIKEQIESYGFKWPLSGKG